MTSSEVGVAGGDAGDAVGLGGSELPFTAPRRKSVQ